MGRRAASRVARGAAIQAGLPSFLGAQECDPRSVAPQNPSFGPLRLRPQCLSRPWAVGLPARMCLERLCVSLLPYFPLWVEGFFLVCFLAGRKRETSRGWCSCPCLGGSLSPHAGGGAWCILTSEGRNGWVVPLTQGPGQPRSSQVHTSCPAVQPRVSPPAGLSAR